jgi:hypothetical protein
VRRQIRHLQDKILGALADEPKPMVDLAALWNDQRADREEAYFNLGYEQGFAAAPMRAGRHAARPWSRAAPSPRRRIMAEIVNANVARREAALALVDVLWVTLLRSAVEPRTSQRREVKFSTAGGGNMKRQW